MSEVEAKFLIPTLDEIPQLIEHLVSGDQEIRPLPSVNIVDRYFDTPDWELFRAGWSYRWRKESGKCIVGLKSVARGNGVIHRRQEFEQQVPEFPVDRRSLPAGQIADQLRNIQQTSLRQLFHVKNRRDLYEIVNPDGALVEFAIDHTSIARKAYGRKKERGRREFCELELELKKGPEAFLLELVQRLENRFSVLPSSMSKFDRGILAVGLWPSHGIEGEGHVHDTAFMCGLRREPLTPDTAAITFVYRAFLKAFESMLSYEPAAWEGLEPEGVHQMRVATRRVRAVLRAFSKDLPNDAVKKFAREFKWLAGVLGTVRDLDVYQVNLRHDMAAIRTDGASSLSEYPEYLAERWRLARRDLLATLSSQRYRDLKQSFASFLQKDPSSKKSERSGSRTVRKTATRLIGKQYRKVLATGRGIRQNSADIELHVLRIECKRLRYLFEVFCPAYDKSLKPSIGRLKRLQDLLGEFHDSCVAISQLRTYAERVPMRAEHRSQLIALGQIIHCQHVKSTSHRTRFKVVWNRFDQERRRKRLLSVLK